MSNLFSYFLLELRCSVMCALRV